MIVGIGIDVVGLERFAGAVSRPGVAERLFAPDERAAAEGMSPDRAIEYLAGRFAAKEALAKALGAPAGLAWTHVCVTTGRPQLELTGTAAAWAEELGVTASHVSITHDAGVAAAVVVLEG